MTDDADIRFEVEAHLSTGRVVTYHVDDARVTAIVARPSWDWPESLSDAEKAYAGVFSDIALRVSKATGFLQADDRDGRWWRIRADSIVAFNVKDYRPPAVPRPIGFDPLIGSLA